MATDIKTIIQNVKQIYMTDSALETLLDFERVLDELGVFVFKNWKLGELVEGPTYEKYFVTCTFMWPYKMMPDPQGGERLLQYDCEVLFKKDTLTYPVKVEDPDDFKDGTKVPKLKELPVWHVTITMPKSLIQEIQQGSVELETETLDLEDIEQGYEDGLDDEVQQGSDEGAMGQNAELGQGGEEEQNAPA